MLAIPHMNDKARGFVVTRSFGCAVFIHASGHRPLRVDSRDGTMFNANWIFAPEARPALELYYKSRDGLNAFGNDSLAHPDHEAAHESHQ
jgi:hypothetical protein